MKPKKKLLRKVLKRTKNNKICDTPENPFDCVLGTCEKCTEKEESLKAPEKAPKTQEVKTEAPTKETLKKAVKEPLVKPEEEVEKPKPRRRGRRPKKAQPED